MITIYWITALLLSAIVGSFLNVLVYRGPAMWGLIDDERGDLARPRSYCPNCKTPIPPHRLIPILSYVSQGGKCAACRARIPARYLFVELTAVVVGAACVMSFGMTPPFFPAVIFGWMLLALAVIDWETGYLPDWMTLPLLALGLAVNAFSVFASPAEALIGAIAGVAAFWSISALWRRLRGVEALGLGDAKLLGAIGAWTGWEDLPVVVLAGSLLSLLGVLAAKMRGADVRSATAIPFGPGLCLAGFATFLVFNP